MSLNQYYLNDISSGIFFRLLSVIIISLTAVIFSKWMVNNGYNKLFSIFFSGTAFVLPTFHVPIFTNTFQFVIIGILACVILLHMYDNYFKNQNISLKNYTYELCKINNKNDLFIKYDPVHLSRYGQHR